MALKHLTALPVYNEARHVSEVLDQVIRYGGDVLVVDDGSSDGTAELLRLRGDVAVLTHPENRGYGAALVSAFRYAIDKHYDALVTIDCDGQHQPQRIPQFVAAIAGKGADERPIDIASGSRYLASFDGDSVPPEERRRINLQVTADLNRRLGLRLTDAFCGFKAYRVTALAQIIDGITESGYAMPLQVWVQAACLGLNVVELPVPIIYLEEQRSFGGALDDGRTRLEYYHLVLDRSLAAIEAHAGCVGGSAPCAKGPR